MELARNMLLLGAMGIIIGLMAWLGLGLMGLARGYIPSCLNCWCCSSVLLVVFGAILWMVNRQ